jgi:ATP/maltotriose-dependent transcriptional regulator MalT
VRDHRRRRLEVTAVGVEQAPTVQSKRQRRQCTGRTRQLDEAGAHRRPAVDVPRHRCGSDWALGVEARSRALVASGDTADALHQEAIDRLDRSPVRSEAARAHLLYGEWLQREDRRAEAQEHLHTAHDAFLAMGADVFADRAARELAAVGVHVRKHTVEASPELSTQEAVIAGLAAEGRTNQEISAAVFLSTRTVEWHLGKVYTKLGITSRRGLRPTLLLQQQPPAALA